MSRSKGRSPLHEAHYTSQLIYVMICVGLPDVPHGGLRFTQLQIFWVRHIGGGHLWHVWRVLLWEDSTTMHWLLHQWEWLERCPNRSRGLREANPDFNYHRKSLLKVNANHADDFQGDWYFHFGGFFIANDTQLDDLIQLQVVMGEKNAEVARSTGLFTHTCLSSAIPSRLSIKSSLIWLHLT